MAEETAPYGADGTPQRARKRIRTLTLQQMTDRGEKWAMLTAYDHLSAGIFDEAGVHALLVGDSAGNNVLGYETTLPVTLDEMVILTRAVSSAVRYALVVADLPFGSYQASPQQAYLSAVRLMKEGGAHAVKLEGGAEMADTIRLLTRGGIPVMAHIGFTPQSEHALGGYRVQGRAEAGDALVADALALQDAGAFSLVMEMVPAPVATRVSEQLRIPTVGIGAGAGTDAQVLVWQDAMGLRAGKMPRFVKQYTNLRETMLEATRSYVSEVADGSFPAAQHSFGA